MGKEESGFEWGKNITINGQAIDANNGETAWGSGLSIEGQSIEESSVEQTARIDITYKTNIVRTIGGRKYESVDNGRQPSVTEIGSTYQTNDYDSHSWLSVGVNVRNPNTNLLAYNVQLELTVKDAHGLTVDVLTDYINFIDADTTFHYGNEFYIDSPTVGQLSCSAYASDFYRIDNRIGSVCTFNDISSRRNSFGDIELFGELRNSGNSDIEWCTGYIQFLDRIGKIKGGACGNVSLVPACQSRPLKLYCNVGIDNTGYVTSTDFRL